MDRAMSLNGYSYVEGNVSNRRDPSGLQSVDWIHAIENPPSLLNAAFDFPNFTSYLADLGHSTGIFEETSNAHDLALILLINQLHSHKCQLEESGRKEEYLNWELWLRLFANGVNITDRRSGYDPVKYLQDIPCIQNSFGAMFGCLDSALVDSEAFQSSIGRQLVRQCLPLSAQNHRIEIGGTLDYLLMDDCTSSLPPPQQHVGPQVLVFGARLFDATATASAIGLDVNLEWYFSLYHHKGGWFLNISTECNSDMTSINASSGVIVGLVGWPDNPGHTTFINSVGGGAATPWVNVGFEGDGTWSSDTGDFVLYFGVGGGISSNGLPASVFASGGASIYLGSDLFNLSDDVDTAVREAVRDLASNPECVG